MHGTGTLDTAAIFVDVGCFELSAEITEITEVALEMALEMARRGGPATAQLGLAMLSDDLVVV